MVLLTPSLVPREDDIEGILQIVVELLVVLVQVRPAAGTTFQTWRGNLQNNSK